MTAEEQSLEQAVNEFRGYYEFSFKSLIAALDEAHISHYSSGCDNKRVTFDIFPASTYVEEMLHMLSLSRRYKPKMRNGFRDALGRTEYSPAVDFIQYLRRWSVFAEQAMRTEGATARGIAAARAKLIMQDLIERLSEDKSGSALRTTSFSRLLYAIGRTLEARQQKDRELEQAKAEKVGQNNYLEAMDAAQGSNLRHPAVA